MSVKVEEKTTSPEAAKLQGETKAANEPAKTNNPAGDVEAAPAGDLKPITDADVLDMGDFGKQMELGIEGDGASPAAPEPKAPIPADKPAAAEKPAKKKYRFGQREFDNAEEAAAYAQAFADNQENLNKTYAAAEAAKPKTPEVDPADIIFEDPKRAIEIIEKRVEDRFNAKFEGDKRVQQARDAETRNWDKFYSDNPDLKGFEDLVAVTLPKLATEKGWNEKTPLEVAFPELASRMRLKLKAAAERFAPAEEIPNKRAVTADGDPAEYVAPKAQDATAVSFRDQIRLVRNKGKLAY